MSKLRSRRLSTLAAVSLVPALLAGCGPEGAKIAPFPGRDPTLRWDSSGALHMVYVVDQGEEARIVYRRLGPDPAGPFPVTPPGVTSTAFSETPPTLERLPGGALLVAYPAALPGKWKSEVQTRLSTDGGRTWGEPRLPHPKRLGAHSFVSSAATREGAVLAWLDNRNGEMGLAVSSTRDGKSFSPSVSPDPKTCQCCATALLAGEAGEQWLVYRDLEPDDRRDFRVLQSRSFPPAFASGTPLSNDGWRIQGCPEAGARLTRAADGTLWAAWFTMGGGAGIYVTSSSDGGASFAPRMRLSEPGKLARHPEIGILPEGRVAAFYETAAGDGKLAVQARVREPGGTWLPARPVAAGGSHPRYAAANGRAALAVGCPTEEERRLAVAWGRDLEALSAPCGP